MLRGLDDTGEDVGRDGDAERPTDASLAEDVDRLRRAGGIRGGGAFEMDDVVG